MELSGKNKTSVPQMITRDGTTRIIMPSRETEPVSTKKEKKTEQVKKTDDQPAQTSSETKRENKSVAGPDSHASVFGMVYANALAESEINKEKPQFPVGSIIVREKLLVGVITPELVIAMVKREKGFSEKTDDWEFFVFDGKDLKIQKRESVGDCAACHAQAKQTDWVFRDYLK